MNEYVRRHLGVKLLLSYLAVIAVGAAVIALTSQSILPTSFSRHMAGMGLASGTAGANNGGMGMGGQGLGARGTMAQLYADFRAGFNDALTYAGLAAIVVAAALSFFFSRSVVAPLRIMTDASKRIAGGRYDERVRISGADELAQLGTRFNQMADNLEQVESMRRRLIADVSHELRTPLAAIIGSMEGLIDGILPSDTGTYQQIHAEAERLNRLVDDLQELSRVEARAYHLNLRPLDPSALAQTVTRRLAPQFESRSISLQLDLAASLPQVLADEDRAIQVLTNLAGNAFQYTTQGGHVTIAAKTVNGAVQFSVQDTGVGIPAEHLAHIFDRFYRVDKSRSRQSGGGSGIGLTIARALVEAQGGRIWVESAGEGCGSTFTFTLPIGR